MAEVAVDAPWPLTPGARPGGPGRCPPVSGPSGACSGCVRTAAGAPPHRGGARGESFGVLLLDPTSAALARKLTRRTKKIIHFPAPFKGAQERGIAALMDLAAPHYTSKQEYLFRSPCLIYPDSK